MDMLSINDMTAGYEILYNGAKVVLQDRPHPLNAIRLLHVGSNLALIQTHIQVCAIVQKTVVSSESGWIRLSKIASEVIGSVCRDSRLMNLMKTILNLSIAL